MRLMITSSGIINTPDATLIKAIAKAHQWFAELSSGKTVSISEIATRENSDKGYVSRVLNLVFLAPEIIEAIIAASQPADLSINKLIKTIDLPMCWQEQKPTLGFAA